MLKESLKPKLFHTLSVPGCNEAQGKVCLSSLSKYKFLLYSFQELELVLPKRTI